MPRPARSRTRAPGGPFDRFSGGLDHLSLRPGRGALILAGALAALTALHTWVAALYDWLTLTGETLPGLRLTALATNGLLARPASVIGVLVLVAIAGLFFVDRLRALWAHDRVKLVGGALGGLVALVLFERFALPGRGYGLVVAGLWLVFVGTAVERRWGARRLLTFAATIVLVTDLIGALLLWVWPAGQLAALGDGRLPLYGEGPLTHALMAMWCFMAGRRRMALLNVEARKLVWVLVAFDGFDLLFGGRIAGLMGLCAIGLTWLLITGNHRPGVALDRLRLWRIERRVKRRRDGIRVVGGRDHLHREAVVRLRPGRPARRPA